MARFLDVHPKDPTPRAIEQAVSILRDGGVMAYPTDSGYALGTCLGNREGKDRIAAIRRLDERHHFTLMCLDFAQMGPLVQLDNTVFRAIKAVTPGPYTFIVPATKEVPRRLMHPRKKTVGVRVPDDAVDRALLEALGEPLLTSSLILPGEDLPMTEGWQVKDRLDHEVDVVIDGEAGSEPTTVVDWSSGYPQIARVGAGDPAPFL